MSNETNIILQKYKEEISNIIGSAFVRAILYGSYASGDFDMDSDIDIMILVNVQEEQLEEFSDQIYDMTYDFEMEHDIEINPSIQSIEAFDHWKEASPLYSSIDKEGIAL